MGTRLVRDRALDTWRVTGAEHQVRPVNSWQEHIDLLRAKLMEEAVEVFQATNQRDIEKELADLLSVMQGLASVHNISWHKGVIATQEERDAASGGFRVGMVWETDR